MPIRAKELKPAEIARLKPRYTDKPTAYPVGGVAGLHIQITPEGAMSWFLRVTIGDKRRRIGLGAYPEVKLGAARDKAREAKDKIAAGIDPIEERKATREALRATQDRLTFAKAVDLYLAAKLAEFRNEKHKAQWRSTLDTYAAPLIGTKACAALTVQDVLAVLQPIWTEKNETASRLRGRIENVLSWATVNGHREGDNPARWKGNLSEILPKPSKVAKGDNQPALQLADAAQWFKELRKRDGVATRALEFVALTAARSGEVRGMTWDEVDMQAKVWIIPAARMKMSKEHTVPLAPAMLALLEGLERHKDSALVFPALRGGQLSDMALSACMKRLHEAKHKRDGKGYIDRQSGRAAVPHGLRSTFRDWAAESGQDHILAELALAHHVGDGTARAYRRSDMLERRREMMAHWAAFLNA
jgi:integrase